MKLLKRREPYLQEVLRFAVWCRAVTLLLQALFNLLIPDHAADAFSPPRLSEPSFCDWLLEWLLGGLSHWDAEHFLFVAEHGYVYEHNFAFFPVYPLSIRVVAEVALWPLQGLLCLRSRLLLSAVLLNTLFSVLAAVVLYELGCVVLQCRRTAFLSAILFCLTPANVFMTAAYSESMFALLAFSAMWQLEKGRSWTSGLLFSFAAGVRSNGVINAGFLLYTQSRRLALQLQAGAGSVMKQAWVWRQLLGLAASVVLTCAGLFLSPALFQLYAYLRFCDPDVSPEHAVPQPLLQLAVDKGYRLAGMTGVKPAWCSHRVPMIYSYIQDVYWNVGFLRYFQLKQIPNFLLAAPITVLSTWAACVYLTANLQDCLTLGLVRRRNKSRGGEGAAKPGVGFCSSGVFVYVVHATTLLVFGLLCMHVQVLTRLLGSSSPVLYWFSAYLLQDSNALLWREGDPTQTAASLSEWPPLGSALLGLFGTGVSENPLPRLLLNYRRNTALTKCVLGYFLSFWLLGLILHCNFLPWT
ncbi:PREDICTED: GPI mannosyltransferase 2 [Gavialis gangeticus]|uniref:GPI mannosyltransferase 2 n=1 Tax=Gavialis gangeticus TaxID=94835 RepID=UPI00092F59C6|nr:PREDICTED: GPI mannosyltransferase 2 [Gavialis gangeticus]XP_019368028.1 PREDICTED: GPI mannosyltransferase 2 [Gavialis gangeticus]